MTLNGLTERVITTPALTTDDRRSFADSVSVAVRSVSVAIRSDTDVVRARQWGRTCAAQQGFSGGDQTVIASAISELARNILQYAREGAITVDVLRRGEVPGIRVLARDRGPGIQDVAQALKDGYSSTRGLGLGLPGVRRLVDEFAVQSQPGQGTTVTVTKWNGLLQP